MDKLFIKNRKNQKISVLIERSLNPQGLVFITHGLGDSKEAPHIEMFAKCFRDNNYHVVRFDTTNSFGESDGKFEDASITNYFEDLEDIINWSKEQSFYIEPFILCGHSIGAISSILYAQKFPDLVKALAPISTVISGELSKEQYTETELANWERTGWLIEKWGKTEVKLKWSYMLDKLKYNILLDVDKLVMPVILIVGELDHCTYPRHQQILFDALPGRKGIYMIKNAPHTFRDPEHLAEIYQILDKWLKVI